MKKERRRINMAICVECVYYQNEDCLNSDLPIDDFIHGTRDCYELNIKGDCKGFKAKSKPESIYETKEDEELASTDQDDND
jgi:hypothetical protein